MSAERDHLSLAERRFLDFVGRHPECLEREAFAELDRHQGLHFRMQSWPLFLSRAARAELARAGEAVCRLVRSVPERVFGNDPGRLAEFYGLGPELAELLAALLVRHGVAGVVGRGDLIWTAQGLKCCEFNITGNLGGWQMGVWEHRYRQIPALACFLAESGTEARVTDPVRSMFEHMVAVGARSPLAAEGEVNLAVALADPPPSFVEMVERVYAAALAARAPGLRGRAVVCEDAALAERGGRLFHGDLPVHLLLDTAQGVVGRAAYAALLAGGVRAFNGPVSQVLSDKRNLVLLSELEGSDLYSAEERAAIRAYIPWSRLVKEEFVDYRGERVYLPDLLLERREEMVLKLALSLGGADVHAGRFLAPEAWEAKVAEALADGRYLVQEFQPSLSYPFQGPQGGLVEHDLVWGAFVYGDAYGGGFLRMLPRNRDIINASRGATEGLIFEVEE